MQNLLKINNKLLLPLLKTQVKGLKNPSGKNAEGKTIVHCKGGGHKKSYRKIDFFRKNLVGIVCSIEYDPNRTAFIASIYNYLKKSYYYVIAPQKLQIGNIIRAGSGAQIRLAHSLNISKLAEGTLIYNLSKNETKKAQISRSAGSFCIIIKKTPKFFIVLVGSGKYYKFSDNCFVSIGIVSNKQHLLKTIKKAGKNRWLNKRPKVRGVAMNPIDHRNGGGEGKKSAKRQHSWGKLKGKKINNEKIY